jgi:predicted AAA+ superfamily ATPase
MIPRIAPLSGKRSFFLFGPRLTGKSTWMNTVLPNALKIDLLEEQNYSKYLSHPESLENEVLAFQKQKPNGWIVIDEIQRVPHLLNEVHRLIEKYNAKFALTGSSARKLKRGGANLLAGRATEMKFFPLTTIELLPDFTLDHAIQWGSLPAVWTQEPLIKKQILRSYASTYLREEIQAEGLVRNLPSFSKVLQLAAENIAKEINYSEISKQTGVTSKTISGYFSILEDTFIGYLLPPWTQRVRKELAGSPKFYFFDNGVTNALRENLTDMPTGEVYGYLFEQFVIQQIRALLSYLEFEGSTYYWKARGGKEVDLIIARGSQPILAIEIKATTQPGHHDFSGLHSFKEEYPSVPTILVTRQPRATLHNNMEGIPVIEFFNRIWSGEWLK